MTIWNLFEQSQTMNWQISNICGIRFYLRIDRFTIQIFLTQSIIRKPWTRYKTIYNFKKEWYDSNMNRFIRSVNRFTQSQILFETIQVEMSRFKQTQDTNERVSGWTDTRCSLGCFNKVYKNEKLDKHDLIKNYEKIKHH